jgi:hypothetical protein
MEHARERSSKERAERKERDGRARNLEARTGPVLMAPGLGLHGIGNRALLSLLRAGRLQRKPRGSEPRDLREHDAVRSADAAVARARSERAADRGDAPPNIRIGAVDDPLEHEADQVADQVMRRLAPEAAPASGPLQIIRKPATCNTEETRLERAQSQTTANVEAPSALRSVLASRGRPLEAGTRIEMEQSFGHDFSDVRVHTDASANDSARAINALAYTFGHNIVFAEDRYQPDSDAGRRLLAHELAHVVQGGTAVRRQPDPSSSGDRPVRARVRRSDIASRGAPSKDWEAQFAPQKPPVDPEHMPSIKAAQAWVNDLDDYSREEKRRFKIGEHLKSMIERLPPEVVLPGGDVIGQSEGKRFSLTEIEGGYWVTTDNLRNKLYTMYLSVDRPAELTAPRDPTGLLWPDYDIQQFVTEEEKAAQERFGLAPEIKPFQFNPDPFTQREVAVLEFLFPDEMLEWRRRDVAVQASVERERDRRTGVFMGALGDVSIKAIGKFFEYTALAGGGAALAPGFASWLGRSRAATLLSRFGGWLRLPSWGARWGGRLLVGTSTGAAISAGTSAADTAIWNAADLATGKMSFGDYLSNIGSSAGSGAKWGGLFGAGGELAAPLLRPLKNFFLPESTIGPVSFRPVSEPPVPAPAPLEPAPPKSATAEVTVSESRPPKPAAPEPASPPTTEPKVSAPTPTAQVRPPTPRFRLPFRRPVSRAASAIARGLAGEPVLDPFGNVTSSFARPGPMPGVAAETAPTPPTGMATEPPVAEIAEIPAIPRIDVTGGQAFTAQTFEPVASPMPVSEANVTPATVPTAAPTSAPIVTQPLAEVATPAGEISAQVEAAFAPGASFAVGTLRGITRTRVTGGGRTIISLDVVPLTAPQRQAAAQLLGQTMPAALQQAWQNTANVREAADLAEVRRLLSVGRQAEAKALARDVVFANHRNRFWRAVRRDPALRQWFTDAGMVFPPGNGPPIYTDPTGGGRLDFMSLEHSERLSDNPLRSVDPTNLQFVLGDENSYFLEWIRANDPFQNP